VSVEEAESERELMGERDAQLVIEPEKVGEAVTLAQSEANGDMLADVEKDSVPVPDTVGDMDCVGVSVFGALVAAGETEAVSVDETVAVPDAQLLSEPLIETDAHTEGERLRVCVALTVLVPHTVLVAVEDRHSVALAVADTLLLRVTLALLLTLAEAPPLEDTLSVELGEPLDALALCVGLGTGDAESELERVAGSASSSDKSTRCGRRSMGGQPPGRGERIRACALDAGGGGRPGEAVGGGAPAATSCRGN
jgi:hypothetical protein